MATGNIPASNGLAGVANLLTLIGGSGKSTSTTKSNITPEGVDALIRQILESTQGLAQVSSGAKSAGLYNSTTQQMLTNDLISRTAGEVAKQTAGTTTITKQDGLLPPVANKLLTGYSLYKFLAGGKEGVGKAVKKLPGADFMFSNVNAVTDFLSGQSSVSPGALFSANSSADPLGALISSQGWAGDVGAATSAEALSGIGGALSATGELVSAGETAGLLAAANATADPLGAFIGSLGYDVAGAGAGSAAAIAGGAEAAGAVASAAEGLSIADVAGAALAWVICTELNSQGKLHDELYKASAERALTLSEEVLRGYHWWAIPFTRVLRRSPTISKLIVPIVKSRCEYLLGKTRIWGWLTVVMGEPVCYAIGKLVKSVEDWRTLYGNAS